MVWISVPHNHIGVYMTSCKWFCIKRSLKFFPEFIFPVLQAFSQLWCDLVESVGTETCDIFSFPLIEVLIWRGTFCRKPHLNRSSGPKAMSNWMILRTIENKNSYSFFWLYLTINAPDFRLIPLDRHTIASNVI